MANPKRRGRKFIGKRLFVAAVITTFFIGVLSGAAILSISTAKIPTSEASPLPILENGSVTRSIKIVSVRSDGSGMVTELAIELEKGTGRILVDTSPLVGFDFQFAERTAVKVASEITGIALDEDGIGLMGVDILFTVTMPKGQQVEIQAIDGPSAGAAATILTLAAFQNKKIKSDVIMTGTIQESHKIGLIGGVYAKAAAAKDNGASLFLVPKGQVVEVYRQVGPFSYTRYEPISYLQDYIKQQGWPLTIAEVSTVEQAAKLMLE